MNTTQIPTQAEYEARERADLMATLRDVERQPRVDAKHGQAAWNAALRGEQGDGIIAGRVAWLLNGSYGWGAMERALAIAGNKRLNQEAMLGQLIAALEWRCPQRLSSEAWKELSSGQQAGVYMAIRREIDYAVKEREEGR